MTEIDTEGVYAYAVRVVPCQRCAKLETEWCVSSLGHRVTEVHTVRLKDAKAFREGTYVRPVIKATHRKASPPARLSRGRITPPRRTRVKNIGKD